VRYVSGEELDTRTNPNSQLGDALFGPNSAGSDRASRAVAYARSKEGAPYVWGAEGPNAFDCSGLVQWAYGNTGVSRQETTYDLFDRPTRDGCRAPTSLVGPRLVRG
jgi:cell wall-associated NlpC family hydrolase